jgi:tetratricopeptide (TPR) repeat protein
LAAPSSISVARLRAILQQRFSPGIVAFMSIRLLRALAIAGCLLALSGVPTHAAEPLPPMAGASEAAAKQRTDLFAELAAAPNEADAREIEQKIWKFWLSFADDESRQWLEQSREAQLRFDYDEALIYMKGLVIHAPQFAEGWNQLGYVYFLAGRYEESLAAIEETLKREPMHYAALAGRGIILIQQGKDAEAQVALKQALAIDPWLKERRLIDGYNEGKKI